MDNQVLPTGNEQAGQPAPAPVQAEYLTREEAKRMADEAAETAFRRAQGLITARDNKIQEKVKEFDAFIALQKQHGVEISDDQAAKMKQTVIANAATELPSASQSIATPAQAPAQDNDTPAAKIVTSMAEEIERELGMTLEESDPEAKLLSQASPWQFLASYRNAVEAKKLRLQTPANQFTTPRTPTNLGAVGGIAPPVREISVEAARAALAKGLSK